jgi:hypothetical protein
MATTKNTKRTTPFSIRLSDQSRLLLRKICDKERRTVSGEIRHLIENEATRLGIVKVKTDEQRVAGAT